MNYIIYFLFILLLIILRNNRYERFGYLYKAGDDPYTISTILTGCVSKIKLDVRFLNKQEGCKELKRKITYFTEMNEFDRKVKGNTIQNCDLIKEWTSDEKGIVLEMINYAQLAKKCVFGFQRKIMSTPWKFVKVSSRVENGFPHTHNDIIFLPENYLTTLVNNNKTQTTSKIYYDLGNIIIHEKVHVWQRQEPEIFVPLYKMLNFEKVKFTGKTKRWLKKNLRTNPDGMDIEWIYMNKDGQYYVLGSLWRNNPTSLSDIDNVAIPVIPNKTHSLWSVQTDNTDDIIPITDLSNWHDIIGLTSNHYHPNEISAEAIARSTLKDKELVEVDIKIEQWFETISIV